MRPDFDASAFHPVTQGLDGTGWNGIDREIDVATFVFPGTSERSGEVSETLDAKRAPRPPRFSQASREMDFLLLIPWLFVVAR